VPVAPLQYQTESQVNAADLVVLVAKWCIALGAVVVGLFALQITSMFIQKTSIVRAQDWISLAIEVVRAATGVWVLGCGLRIVRGRYGTAQRLWMALAAMVLINVIGVVSTLIFYAQNSYYAGSPTRQGVMMISVVLRGITFLMPAGVLLTIMRQPAVRDAIEEY
jgi:hypothetical protein